MRALKSAATVIFQNFFWKLLSLAIAVVIWALVASEPEVATFASVRVEYRNLPGDLEIGAEPVSTILLELRGPSGVLRNVGESGGFNPSVVFDLHAVREGIRTFMVGQDNVRLPQGVRLLRAIPSEVRLDLERRDARTVPVEPHFSGEGRNGYVIAHYAVSPERVTVVGPARRLARVTVALTDPVDVSNVVGTANFQANAYVNDPYVRFQGASEVTVSVAMKKK